MSIMPCVVKSDRNDNVRCALLRLAPELHSIIIEFLQENKEGKTALLQLSKTNHYFREITLPALFRSIRIFGDWETASTRLSQVRKYRYLLPYTKIFEFSIKWSCRSFQPQVLFELREVLSDLRSLETLVFDIPRRRATQLRDTFKDIEFPFVKTLNIVSCCDFIIPLCSSLIGNSTDHRRNSVSTLQPYTKLLPKATHSASLKVLEVDVCYTSSLLNTIVKHLPALEILLMKSGSSISIFQDVKTLARLPSLKILALPDIRHLGVGCRNMSWLRNPQQRSKEAEEKVARIVVSRLKNLTELRVGNSSRAIILYGDGYEGKNRGRRWVWERGTKMKSLLELRGLRELRQN